jgi:site-specific DNA recombinase
LAKAQEHVKQQTHDLQAELAAIQRQRNRDEADLKKLVGAMAGDSSLARLADLQERLRLANERSNEILGELDGLAAEQIDETEVAAALAEFDEIWQVLSPRSKPAFYTS